MLTPLLLLIGLSAQQAPPAAAQPEDIVVTGSRPLERKAATAMVVDTAKSVGGQLARFHDPVCPIVLGLGERMGEEIVRHIRDQAKAIGAPVAPTTRCEANLILIAASDPRAMMKDIARNYPGWLEGLDAVDLRALESETGPVRAWSVTSTRNEDGIPTGKGNDVFAPESLRVMTASILTQPTRKHIDASVLVFDSKALLGKSLGQVGDYALMRGLAMTRPPKEAQPAATILGLFSGAGAPGELTAFDRRYLSSLYSAVGTLTAVQQRARIAKAVSKR